MMEWKEAWRLYRSISEFDLAKYLIQEPAPYYSSRWPLAPEEVPRHSEKYEFTDHSDDDNLYNANTSSCHPRSLDDAVKKEFLVILHEYLKHVDVDYYENYDELGRRKKEVRISEKWIVMDTATKLRKILNQIMLRNKPQFRRERGGYTSHKAPLNWEGVLDCAALAGIPDAVIGSTHQRLIQIFGAPHHIEDEEGTSDESSNES